MCVWGLLAVGGAFEPRSAAATRARARGPAFATSLKPCSSRALGPLKTTPYCCYTTLMHIAQRPRLLIPSAGRRSARRGDRRLALVTYRCGTCCLPWRGRSLNTRLSCTLGPVHCRCRQQLNTSRSSAATRPAAAVCMRGRKATQAVLVQRTFCQRGR